MAPARSTNWEEEFLTHGLSGRAQNAGVAYAGPGSGNDVPRQLRPPIAFTGGIPDPKALPIDELAAATQAVLRRDGVDALTYGGSQGYAGLRAWLAAHWTQIEGTELTPANYTLTIGSAHALENVCETFLNAGDVVIVEAPSFPGSIRTIRSLGCDVESVSMDAEGLDVDELAAKIAQVERGGRRVKLLYTIPNYHNPTGATLSAPRRTRLLDLCEQHDILVVEDDAYGELGYGEPLPPSLYSLSRGRGVVKLGTFSKIIATGLRTGWVQATPPIIDALVATRFDMGTSPLLLRTIAELAGGGQLEAHIEELCLLYGRKRDLMLNELRERAGSLATWTEPDGGFFLWLKLNEAIDPVKLRRTTEEEGVAYGPGGGFFAGMMGQAAAARAPYVRLAFSYTDEALIPEGVRRLSRALERAAEPD
ncbi:MAG: aminotransferase class I/II-fold pyridoxal phosphate-dependent enzyme [Dehalococcoidia bacterium]|nr:aminotransferase class I/II-fold pyridoxal phosphate-dependent enzyme [Dehalococcoidia bacterium]